MRKTVSWIMLTLLLTSALTLAFSIQPVKAEGTIYIRANGSVDPSTAPIQRDGDVYTLTDNVYDEIVVEKSNITIDGNGYVLQGSQAGYGFSLSSVNGVIIRNLTISNFDCGIYFKYSSNDIIAGNHITANKYGGIRLDFPSNNTISGNNITANNGSGIDIIGDSIAGHPSNNNTIVGNSITANYWWGVYLYYSSYNSIAGNNIENQEYGVYLHYSPYNNIVENNIANNDYGVYLEYSPYHSIVGNNIADSEYGVYLDYSPYNNIVENSITVNNDYGIYLLSSPYQKIVGNNITANNWFGVYLSSSSYNSIVGNNITANNWFGVYLLFSSNNSVVENNIENNTYGVYLHSSPSNVFHWNNFVDNQFQASIYETSVNVWGDGYPSGGNYWSDYNGTDSYSGPYQNETGSDGIGDTPYNIDTNNRDNYPLTKRYPWGSHDIGVTYIGKVWEIYFQPIILPLKTIVGLGFKLHINVFAINYGAYSEVFNVTVYANTTAIETITNITVASRNSVILNFTWDTAGFVKGNYTIWANASPVPSEIDKADNTLVYGTVIVTIPSDVVAPYFEVDIYDVTAICVCYDSKMGSPHYNPNCDLDGNGIIDIFDVTTACITYGQKDP